ncbi:MAG TPA: hypothetical protein VN719_09470 [Gemmatimonadales bacterium]|nr:hypothetical protein [Gemmatimonadales bacterium]
MFDRHVMLEAAYRKGWDAAVRYAQLFDNPYRRVDYRDRWERGFRDCEGSATNTRPGYTHYDDRSAARVVGRIRRAS